MIEASAKLKFIFFIDAVLFLLCAAGIISINQKASLPFEFVNQDSFLSIQISKLNPYGLTTGDKIISVDGLRSNTIEKIEFITDRKNIAENILISVQTKTGINTLSVKATPDACTHPI